MQIPIGTTTLALRMDRLRDGKSPVSFCAIPNGAEYDVYKLDHRMMDPETPQGWDCPGVQSNEQSKLIARAVRDVAFQLLDSPNHVVVPSEPSWAALHERLDWFLAGDIADESALSEDSF